MARRSRRRHSQLVAMNGTPFPQAGQRTRRRSGGHEKEYQACAQGRGGQKERIKTDIPNQTVLEIEAEATRQGVNQTQALAIAQIESGGRMSEVTGRYSGIYQLSAEDTKEFGRPGDNHYDKATNIRVGIAQWKQCLKTFHGNEHYACVAYNRGIGATRKWIREGANVAMLPEETQAYLRKYDRLMNGPRVRRADMPVAQPKTSEPDVEQIMQGIDMPLLAEMRRVTEAAKRNEIIKSDLFPGKVYVPDERSLARAGEIMRVDNLANLHAGGWDAPEAVKEYYSPQAPSC